MDPNANLKETLDLARAVLDDDDVDNPDAFADAAVNLAAHVMALHDWMSADGVAPAAWKRSQR